MNTIIFTDECYLSQLKLYKQYKDLGRGVGIDLRHVKCKGVLKLILDATK